MLYTVTDAAQYLSVSASAVYKWAESGILKGKKYGSVWRFTQEALDNPSKPDTAPLVLEQPAKKENSNGRIRGQTKRKLVLPI